MEPNEFIAANARHHLRNCRSSFRLLQGALLSGTVRLDAPRLRQLEERIINLELQEMGSSAAYDPDDARWNDIQLFFLQVPDLVKDASSQHLEIPRLPQTTKKLLVIDDLVEKAGWKDVFEVFLGQGNLLTATSREEGERLILENIHEIYSVFIDINIEGKTNLAIHESVVERQPGLQMIADFSIRYPHLPIVAFTAYDSSIIAKLAFENGAWDYFTKEPEGRETKQWREAFEYFKSILEILSRHIEFSQKYPGLFERVDALINQMRPRMDPAFFALIEKNLFLAYKYLSMESRLRFKPAFLDFNRCEEVVFQASKAIDTFCAVLLERYRIYPEKSGKRYGRYSMPTLGGKMHMLRENDRKLRLGQHWADRMGTVIRLRNNNTHQEVLEVPEGDAADPGRRDDPNRPRMKYRAKSMGLEEKEALKFFGLILELMEDALYLLKDT